MSDFILNPAGRARHVLKEKSRTLFSFLLQYPLAALFTYNSIPWKNLELNSYFQQGPLGCNKGPARKNKPAPTQGDLDARTDGVGCNFKASLHIFDHHPQFCGSLAMMGQTLSMNMIAIEG